MYRILLTAFPMSEKELSGLFIVKEGHSIIFFFGGGGLLWLVFCYVCHTLEISHVILADCWFIDVTVNCN
jgi:hypothetical protein